MKNQNNLAELLDIKNEPTDKDGINGSNDVININIGIALNGYIITFLYEDDTTAVYVETDFDEALKLVRSHH